MTYSYEPNIRICKGFLQGVFKVSTLCEKKRNLLVFTLTGFYMEHTNHKRFLTVVTEHKHVDGRSVLCKDIKQISDM